MAPIRLVKDNGWVNELGVQTVNKRLIFMVRFDEFKDCFTSIVQDRATPKVSSSVPLDRPNTSKSNNNEGDKSRDTLRVWVPTIPQIKMKGHRVDFQWLVAAIQRTRK